MSKIFFGIKNLFRSRNIRSERLKINILLSVFIKSFSILIQLVIVPIFLNYLDEFTYGVWITISSIVLWFEFFDIGLGKGLQNKLSESLAVKNYSLAKDYISTTYAMITVIAVLFLIIGIIIIPILNWSIILNTPADLQGELMITILIVYLVFWPRFILKIINTILYADQRPAFSNSLSPLSNLIILFCTIILIKVDNSGSLIYLALIIGITPIFILIVVSFILFRTKYRKLSPSIKNIKLIHTKSLFSLGTKFFLIQVSIVLLFQTTAIIISQFFNPSYVTKYNISYKYFSLIYMIFTIVITPFWAAFTEAWVKKDISWIKKSINNLILFWIALLIFGVTMLVFSNPIYRIWVGPEISIPFNLSFSLLIYFSILTFGGIFNMFINGISKLKLQMIFTGIGAVVFIPTAYIFTNYLKLGVEGVIYAMIISNLYHPIIAPLQYYKIISGKAKGIWIK